ncbi:hypothetical protein LCGC14_1592160 [marine sediment metagenome]|uniref:Uncharacterized protein n=1 Tax=marine sediment metagenome TaxID=412755 RepID=A0A0F9IDJ7_9ZZZZ
MKPAANSITWEECGKQTLHPPHTTQLPTGREEMHPEQVARMSRVRLLYYTICAGSGRA